MAAACARSSPAGRSGPARLGGAPGGAGDDVQYQRPAPGARYALFDFFRSDYMWIGHFGRDGQPDPDYLRNRVARLTFDLRTGDARVTGFVK